MKRLQKCHGCCKLRTGTIVTGTCGMLLALGMTISYWLGLVNPNMEECESLKYAIKFSYVYIITDALLIYGAVKKSRFFLLPWMLSVCLIIVALLVESFLDRDYYRPFCIIFALMSAELWYVLICVISYFKELSELKTAITSDSGHPAETQPAITTSFDTFEPQLYADVGKDPVNV